MDAQGAAAMTGVKTAVPVSRSDGRREMIMGIAFLALLIVGILIASVAERRRMAHRRWHHRRMRSRLRGFVRRPGGCDEWDRGL